MSVYIKDDKFVFKSIAECTDNCDICEPTTYGTRCIQCRTVPDVAGLNYGLDASYMCSR